MPELPEVETTCRGIAPYLRGVKILSVRVRQPQLRWPVPAEVMGLRDMPVVGVRRRAKFVLIDLAQGQLLIHLGMSGSLRVLPVGTPAGKHDHVDVLLDSGQLLRLNDPRRFGAVLWSEQIDGHPLLGHLGPEPLQAGFDGQWLAARAAGRKQSVKTFIMDNRTVVGVGNIYAQESLFLAGIHPSRQAGRISRERYIRLAEAIRTVLGRAIEAGGTTLRDFSRVDGQPGYFAQDLSVYGRAGQSCLICGTILKGARHGQRTTCYCPQCQR
ncbi:bifunctional DNA-formamidopyrimidine glycosylase/DNA-(apurinic or apyrimidinic site) lyase [Alcanivorax sp. 1008]|uniref:bifunctional DNA-formamidopyrimidine glycosylase/DNA-(apurinic or apyrimidinic site) lyase n=1 Tax=Alcanivorax sp. 1008 TaxID=2816853 RepID=UPI001DC9D9F0|nr:bifunctional DNA-formamidopyrimidine glycosylase/DNA-(apurinic or apyrimidinic site) lyase [Alcanivorax sp. 1008]MCC1496914.1 bifunctional DNA-formamidopyrimidine glycosylase/DNA-(apurinic or apyrimidinic site) lyase [Alcanivorax sp. 1008]